MCGINGIFDFKNKYSAEERYALVHEMNERIIYRGPDHEGIYQCGNLTMGMRRLAILDLQAGNQPIYNEDKSIVVVYNGEIYNFQAIRQGLLKRGHAFATAVDTEVIVHAYEEYGTDAFALFDGMYAISLYDMKKQKLFLIRDRMGEKPLHYCCFDGIFIWGSELKSILGTGIIRKEICIDALNQYFQLTYIPAPLTIYEGIRKLEPGHYLEINEAGQISDYLYWSLRNVGKNDAITYMDAKEILKKLVHKSIEERMVSDVPLGAFLSGGVDSGSVVSVMSQYSKEPIKTFTIGFNEKEYDERQRAKLVADMYHTEHYAEVLDYDDVLGAIDDIIGKLDEPFADSSVLPTYFVSKFAAQNVKVVLTGDAGDELFFGYSKYLIDYYSALYRKFPAAVRKLFKKTIYMLPDRTVITRKVRKVLDLAMEDSYTRRLKLMCMGFKQEQMKMLLKPAYQSDTGMDFIKKRYDEPEQSTEWMRTQYVDLSVVLEGDMLAKVDRMSMLNSLETRTPLLSKDIIEFAFSLPESFKIRGKELKYIYRDCFKDMLPKGFTELRKSGFGIPLDYWFRNQLKGMVEELLCREKIEKQGIFNYDYIRQILNEHFAGKVNHKSEIWALVVFQKWYGEQ